MAVDKNQAIINYLITCPIIKNSPLFFNFINAKDENKQIVTLSNDKNMQAPFVDGSVQKMYSFTIIDFKSISYNAIVKMAGYADENVEDMEGAQSIIDWINEQDTNRNFPDFGEDCIIDSIEALSENPNINGVDTSMNPPLARYSISIRVTYLDKSKMIWGN